MNCMIMNSIAPFIDFAGCPASERYADVLRVDCVYIASYTVASSCISYGQHTCQSVAHGEVGYGFVTLIWLYLWVSGVHSDRRRCDLFG